MTLPAALAAFVALCEPAGAQSRFLDDDCPGPGCPPVTAVGDPISAEEIVRHLTRSMTCDESGHCYRKARTAAVCIGTEAECSQPRPSDPAAFDLLVTFELDSDRLTSRARANLEQFAIAMKQDRVRNVKFNIDGHTDARGNAGYNMRLSERRAQAVVRYLEQLGVSGERLVAQGYGESRPRTADPFDAINRRVEATVRFE